jgi:ubiquinone/menaquinone biosynthesis C-methylase UbiE
MTESPRNETAKTFDAAADGFDHPALSFWDRYGRRSISLLGLKTGDRVLDLCCGTGASAIPAAQAVGITGHVTGIDISEGMLALARKKAEEARLTQVEFRNQDADLLAFPAESLDAAICVFGLYFLPDMESMLRRMWNWLKPGGKIVITAWGPRAFEPAESLFMELLEAEKSNAKDLPAASAWERLKDVDAMRTLFSESGINSPSIFEERDILRLNSPEDWWKITLGSSGRALIEALPPKARDRLHARTIHEFTVRGIEELEISVIYGIATKRVI